MRLAILCLFTGSSLFAQSVRLQEPWAAGYTGEDSTGAHVLGHWKFDGDSALKDVSGHGNDLQLHGAALVSKGKFGGALESFPGFPVTDQSHAAHTGLKPKLSPKGAFTLELWANAKEEFAPELRCYLIDKKYVDHTDYQWTLGNADKAGLRRMAVNLGFGSESKAWHSDPIKIEAGKWHHYAFTYDGAGTGRFIVDGRSAGTMHNDGCTSIVAGAKPLSIGDRLGSNYGGFPGFVDEVRICEGVLNFERVDLQITSTRHVWRRMEPEQKVRIDVTNLQRETMDGGKLRVVVADKEEVFDVKTLKSGKTFTASHAFNTALKPGLYTLRARLELDGYATEKSEDFEIVARALPDVMPVVMWGASPEDAPLLRDIGFTHCAGLGVETASEMWQQKKVLPPGKPESIDKKRAQLDEALRNGISVFASLSPGNALEHDASLLRVGRDGKPYTRQDIDASNPDLLPFFENVGKSVAKTYGDHPAFAAALIDSEVRDASAPSFNAIDVENYRKFANADIPAAVKTRGGVDWQTIKDFPKDRVIADDDAILKYYRWFWTVGDGWNALHSALAKGVKTNNSDVWTWFDPAVRQPSISGAGGSVDVLSHWTYTYPDPLRIGLATDQLFAMSAASGRNQRVMKMTQLIWYRSQTAPTSKAAPGNVVAWEDHDPDAAYITIAPMHLKEAFWAEIARPIQGIMYHGWQSLVPIPGNTAAYRFTNPNTVHVLKELTHNVVQPLGPTLMQLTDERAEVAYLESFTSQMFAKRGGYGSNMGWSTDVWLALQHAHVRCDIMFEETLLKSGLGARKYLVMPECDVLTRSVVDKIAAWQKKGGKLIADEFLCPALKADVVLNTFKREKKADTDKAKTLALANTLRDAFSTLALQRTIDCDNPEIIVRTRRAGDGLYLFAVNDHREFGTYVGQHGLVMENGSPSTGNLTLAGEGNIYDLTRHRVVLPTRSDKGLVWPLTLGPCDGSIFLITPKPLMDLKVELSRDAKAGESADLSIQVTDTTQGPVKAAIPAEVQIYDANGKSAERSGYYALKNGVLKLRLDIAINDDPGTWEVRVRELATGMEQRAFMKVVR